MNLAELIPVGSIFDSHFVYIFTCMERCLFSCLYGVDADGVRDFPCLNNPQKKSSTLIVPSGSRLWNTSSRVWKRATTHYKDFTQGPKYTLANESTTWLIFLGFENFAIKTMQFLANGHSLFQELLLDKNPSLGNSSWQKQSKELHTALIYLLGSWGEF